eukprot:1116480-Prymnesium_polylepis.1
MSTFAMCCQYARGWLLLDVTSSVPLDWFFVGIQFDEPGSGEGTAEAANVTSLLRIFKLVKLLRLLRIARLFR